MTNETIDNLTEQLHQWQNKWKPAIEKWIAINRSQHDDFARMVEPIPSLILLIVNLIKDPNVPDDVRHHLITTADYVFNDTDQLPESELGVVGLVDDAIQMGDILNEMVLHFTPALNVNWSGKGNILDVIEYIVANRGKYVREE